MNRVKGYGRRLLYCLLGLVALCATASAEDPSIDVVSAEDSEEALDVAPQAVVRGRECVAQLPEVLRKFLRDCTLVEDLNPGKIRRALNAQRPIAVPIAGENVRLTLRRDLTLFPATAIKGVEFRRFHWSAKAVSNTFVGTILDASESDAAVTISDDNQFIYGFGSLGGEAKAQFYFETLPEPRRKLLRVLTYRGSDVIINWSLPDDDAAKPQGRNRERFVPQLYTNQRILGHGDLSFINHLGSISGAFARMEFLLTCVRLYYNLFTDVRFQIAELWLRLSNFGPTDATALRDTFQTHMESAAHQPGATYHVAHLFTGVNTNGSTIGLSQFPGAGPLGHYAISQMVPEPGFYDATVYGQGILVAHEIGHNYDATHGSCDSGPPADIMCAGGLGGPETRIVSFSGASVGLIDAEEAVKTTR